ncbi:MAG: propanediol utilization protein [Ardenticatenia bacterium]|jgi:microcompartment protein CcmL/EutN|nr:MAG: propanediol utilization protein [Ardenticatenia bacterium]
MSELEPALALIEFSSIAVGMLAADAMVKKAPIARIVAGTTQPGKYLVLISGEVADVQESLAEGREVGKGWILDTVFLPHVHPAVVAAIAGAREVGEGEALGIIETHQVASTIQAADAGVKGAQVTLREIRLADGLCGKAFCLFQGAVSDVEAAVEIGVNALADPSQLVRQVVIPQLHEEMLRNLQQTTYFGRLAGRGGGEA